MIEILANALVQIFILSLPFLLVGLVISLAVGFFQAVTQIQDATIPFVSRLAVLLILLVIGMPWFLQMMTDYSRNLMENITISTTP